jgi:hypothetical protein
MTNVLRPAQPLPRPIRNPRTSINQKRSTLALVDVTSHNPQPHRNNNKSEPSQQADAIRNSTKNSRKPDIRQP